MEILINALIRSTGWSIIHSLWQGAILYTLLLLLFLLNPKLSAKSRHNLSFMALIGIFLWFAQTFYSEFSKWMAIGKSIEAFAGIPLNYVPNIAEIPSSLLFDKAERSIPLIVFIYTSGLILQILFLLLGYYKVLQIKTKGLTDLQEHLNVRFSDLSTQLGIKRAVRFVQSSLVSVPLVIGYFKPMVLLPLSVLSRFNPRELEAIIIHELSHVRRNDYLLNILKITIETILFFNPFVWLSGKIIDTERENACDDLVLNITGSPLSYAMTLLELEKLKQGQGVFSLAITGKKHYLLNRIKRITNMKTSTLNLKVQLLIILLTATAVVSLAWIPVKKEKIARLFNIESKNTKNDNKQPQNHQYKVVNAAIADLTDTSKKAKAKVKIVLEDENGNKKEYNSLQEMPAEARTEFLKQNKNGIFTPFTFNGDTILFKSFANTFKPDSNFLKAFKFTPDSNFLAAAKNFKMPEYFNGQQWKDQQSKMMEYFKGPDWKNQMDHFHKVIQSPEWKKQQNKMMDFFTSPEWNKQKEDIFKQNQKLQELLKSPEYKKLQKELMESPEYKKLMKDATPQQLDMLNQQLNMTEYIVPTTAKTLSGDLNSSNRVAGLTGSNFNYARIYTTGIPGSVDVTLHSGKDGTTLSTAKLYTTTTPRSNDINIKGKTLTTASGVQDRDTRGETRVILRSDRPGRTDAVTFSSNSPITIYADSTGKIKTATLYPSGNTIGNSSAPRTEEQKQRQNAISIGPRNTIKADQTKPAAHPVQKVDPKTIEALKKLLESPDGVKKVQDLLNKTGYMIDTKDNLKPYYSQAIETSTGKISRSEILAILSSPTLKKNVNITTETNDERIKRALQNSANQQTIQRIMNQDKSVAKLTLNDKEIYEFPEGLIPKQDILKYYRQHNAPRLNTIPSPKTGNNNSKMIWANATTDTVKLKLVNNPSGKEPKGIFVIGDKVFDYKQLINEVAKTGHMEFIVLKPMIGVYTEYSRDAIAQWGDAAKDGVFFIKPAKAG